MADVSVVLVSVAVTVAVGAKVGLVVEVLEGLVDGSGEDRTTEGSDPVDPVVGRERLEEESVMFLLGGDSGVELTLLTTQGAKARAGLRAPPV